jgi:hypothetical protein
VGIIDSIIVLFSKSLDPDLHQSDAGPEDRQLVLVQVWYPRCSEQQYTLRAPITETRTSHRARKQMRLRQPSTPAKDHKAGIPGGRGLGFFY